MPVLEVRSARRVDIYRDIARVPESHRVDSRGRRIPEGRICEVTVGSKSWLLSLRGQQQHSDPAIHLDDYAREKLGLEKGKQVNLTLRQVGWLGQFLWTWRATDPLYRIAARVGGISVLLSFLGLVAGILGILLSVPHSK